MTTHLGTGSHAAADLFQSHRVGSAVFRPLSEGTVGTTVATQIGDREKHLRAVGEHLAEVLITDLSRPFEQSLFTLSDEPTRLGVTQSCRAGTGPGLGG